MSQVLGKDDGLSVSEAAEVLGISPGAVRKRIKRGTLDAVKEDGQWWVIVDVEDYERTSQQVEEESGDDGVGQEVALETAQRQMELFRDSFVMPLVEQIRELERENGELSQRNRTLEEELSRRDQIEEKPWWRFW